MYALFSYIENIVFLIFTKQTRREEILYSRPMFRACIPVPYPGPRCAGSPVPYPGPRCRQHSGRTFRLSGISPPDNNRKVRRHSTRNACPAWPYFSDILSPFRSLLQRRDCNVSAAHRRQRTRRHPYGPRSLPPKFPL